MEFGSGRMVWCSLAALVLFSLLSLPSVLFCSFVKAAVAHNVLPQMVFASKNVCFQCCTLASDVLLTRLAFCVLRFFFVS